MPPRTECHIVAMASVTPMNAKSTSAYSTLD
jgi:hypothetical protein